LHNNRTLETAQAFKTTPHINTIEKDPLWYQVLFISSTTKKKKEVNGDQMGCRLDLKPAPDES
jgi:hypothetical protein